MGNPFAITSDELLKKTQGTKGAGTTSGTQNTQETRAAKEKEQLSQTNVLNQTNGGSMATTDGTFENYDGFQRTTQNVPEELQEREESKSLIGGMKSSIKDSEGAKSNANNASERAIEDARIVEQQAKQVKSKEKATINKVNQTNDKIDPKIEENQQLESEVNEIESEIESLMAEDGQDYTAQTVTADDAPPQVPVQADVTAGTQNTQTQSDNMGQATGAGNGNAGGQGFAMWSLPAQQAPAAPTSETAVAAQNNNNAQNNQATSTQQNNNKQQKTVANRTSSAGSSLNAFGSTVKPTGKNADKINELMSESSSKKATMGINSSSILAMRTANQNLLNSSIKFTQSAVNVASQKKAASQEGQKTAQLAQQIGTGTTALGGTVTGVGLAMQLSANPTTVALGVTTAAWGGVGSGVGAATTGAAAIAQGNTTEGVNATNTGIQQGLQSALALKNTKTS